MVRRERGHLPGRQQHHTVWPSELAGTSKGAAASWGVPDIEGVVAALSAKGVTSGHYDDLPGVDRQGDIHVRGGLRAVWTTGNILSVENVGLAG